MNEMTVSPALGPGDDDGKDRGLARAVTGPLAPGHGTGEAMPAVPTPLGPGDDDGVDRGTARPVVGPAAPGDGVASDDEMVVFPAAGPGDRPRPTMAIRRVRKPGAPTEESTMANALQEWSVHDVQRPAVAATMHHAWTVFLRAKLQILRAIIENVAVDVMHGFVVAQIPTQCLLHHEAVFAYVPAPSVGMVGAMEVSVPVAHSAPGVVPMLRPSDLDPMAANKRRRVSAEVSSLRKRDLRDRRLSATATLATAGRDLIRLRNRATRAFRHAGKMARQKTSRMVFGAFVCRQQLATAATFAEFRANCVNHAS